MENAIGHIGIFGGSFSPPHVGHVLACHYALLRWGLKKVLVIPSFQHPFNKPLPAFEHRLTMCRLAFEHLGDSIEVSNLEQQMGGVSYTIETLRELRRRHPDEHYNLLVGGDILPDTKKWREFEELTRLAPMLVIPRISDGEILGGTELEAALPDISSTTIRSNLAAGKHLHGAVPLKVLQYIAEHNLYAEPDTAT